MKPIRHTGLLVALVALFVSLSIPGYTLPPAKEDPQAFEAARKKFLDVRDADGMSALHNAVIQNKKEYAGYLIEMGADLEARDSRFGMTPLCFSVYQGNLEMTEFLINSGADIDTRIVFGYTPLHLAATSGNLEMTRLLIRLGANVHARRNKGGYTPLLLASCAGHYEVVELLIENGADVNAKAGSGKTPLDYATKNKRGDVKELLIRHGAVKGVARRGRHSVPSPYRNYEVYFDSNPPGARVEVERTLLCEETPCTRNLNAGTYNVRMQMPWNYYRAGQLTVGKKTALKWDLEHRPAKLDVLIIYSKEFKLYTHAIDGFESVYQGKIEYHRLGDGHEGMSKSFDLLQRANPRMILTIGLRASKWAAWYVHNIPIIFCMSLNSGQNHLKTPTSTGVAMSAPPKEQLLAFKQAIPGLRRIGIVYDPKRTGEFVLGAGLAAGKLGLRLVHRQVSTTKDASRAMSNVAKHADALWLIRDATVSTGETFKEAVEIQSRQKIPLLTDSEEFVVAGAFASYTAEYYEQGELAAQMARQIESGTLPRNIPVQHPQGGLMINLDVAEQLSSKFKVPPDILFSGDVRKYKQSWGLERDLAGEKTRMR